jgi:LysM repeat protein
MNNPNPFLPQGVFLDQKAKARTRLKIAVLSSISLMSVMVLAALLIQGCKKPAEPGDTAGGTNDSLSNTPQLGTSVPETNTSNTVATTPAPETNMAPPPVMSNTPPPVVAQPPPPVPEAQEYTIVKGDLLSHIATANHTTVKAIMDANPGLDPKKLKIGQKIKLPAPASGSSAPVNSMGAPAMPVENSAASGGVTYKVKSGDTLTTIAKHFHVSIKAIQSANSLSTTSIKVGQVLKIPGAAAPAPAPEAAPVPAPAPVAAPMAAPTSPTTIAPTATH